jgi:beta-phosphoglucomutase
VPESVPLYNEGSPRVCELGLIFDMDGVVVHSNPVHRQAWQLYTRRFGIETTEAMIERMYGKRNDEIVRDFFGPLTPAEAAAHGTAKEALYRELMAGQVPQTLVPGVLDFLTRHAKSPLAMATNAVPANVAFVLESSGLCSFFPVVVDGTMVPRPKPFPDVFLHAAKRIGVAPEACVVFEDSRTGVAAARAAGMRTVGLLTTHAELAGVDLAIRNFLDPKLEIWLRTQTRLAS